MSVAFPEDGVACQHEEALLKHANAARLRAMLHLDSPFATEARVLVRNFFRTPEAFSTPSKRDALLLELKCSRMNANEAMAVLVESLAGQMMVFCILAKQGNLQDATKCRDLLETLQSLSAKGQAADEKKRSLGKELRLNFPKLSVQKSVEMCAWLLCEFCGVSKQQKSTKELRSKVIDIVFEACSIQVESGKAAERNTHDSILKPAGFSSIMQLLYQAEVIGDEDVTRWCEETPKTSKFDENFKQAVVLEKNFQEFVKYCKRGDDSDSEISEGADGCRDSDGDSSNSDRRSDTSRKENVLKSKAGAKGTSKKRTEITESESSDAAVRLFPHARAIPRERILPNVGDKRCAVSAARVKAAFSDKTFSELAGSEDGGKCSYMPIHVCEENQRDPNPKDENRSGAAEKSANDEEKEGAQPPAVMEDLEEDVAEKRVHSFNDFELKRLVDVERLVTKCILPKLNSDPPPAVRRVNSEMFKHVTGQLTPRMELAELEQMLETVASIVEEKKEAKLSKNLPRFLMYKFWEKNDAELRRDLVDDEQAWCEFSTRLRKPGDDVNEAYKNKRSTRTDTVASRLSAAADVDNINDDNGTRNSDPGSSKCDADSRPLLPCVTQNSVFPLVYERTGCLAGGKTQYTPKLGLSVLRGIEWEKIGLCEGS